MSSGPVSKVQPAAQAFVQSLDRPVTLNNPVRDLAPGTIFLVLICLGSIAASRPGLVWPAAVCLSYVGIGFLAGVGRSFALNYLRVALFAGLILFVARALTMPGERVFFRFGGLQLSPESIASSGRFVLTVLGLCGAVIMLFSLVPVSKMMLALEAAGVTHRVTFMVLASFQAIANMGSHSRVVRAAQESRGIEMKGSIGRRLKAFISIIAPTFLAALNETEERALALDARAFNSPRKRTHVLILRKRTIAEYVLMAAAVAAAAASIVGAVTQWF